MNKVLILTPIFLKGVGNVFLQKTVQYKEEECIEIHEYEKPIVDIGIEVINEIVDSSTLEDITEDISEDILRESESNFW